MGYVPGAFRLLLCLWASHEKLMCASHCVHSSSLEHLPLPSFVRSLRVRTRIPTHRLPRGLTSVTRRTGGGLDFFNAHAINPDP